MFENSFDTKTNNIAFPLQLSVFHYYLYFQNYNTLVSRISKFFVTIHLNFQFLCNFGTTINIVKL